jgi:quercetin dioxygenase-like cupin family protein
MIGREMRIKTLNDVRATPVPGYVAVSRQVLIGIEHGSEEMVLRHFEVAEGCKTPYHQHDFPHLVKIEAGQGFGLDADRRENRVTAGDCVYVPSNELHGFVNTGYESLEFICIVPTRGEPTVDPGCRDTCLGALWRYPWRQRYDGAVLGRSY